MGGKPAIRKKKNFATYGLFLPTNQQTDGDWLAARRWPGPELAQRPGLCYRLHRLAGTLPGSRWPAKARSHTYLPH